MRNRRKRPAEKTGKREAAGGAISVKRIGFAVGIGMFILLLTALVLSVLTASGTLPAEHIQIYTGGAIFAGGFACSIVAGGNKRKLLSALLAVAGMLVLLAIAGIAAFSGAFVIKNFLMVLILLLISCMIGSVISTALH